jgi:CHAT domain-containing protein/Tfp pilus assembly protein PilF
MGAGGMVCRLAALVVAGVVGGIVLTGAARAQTAEDAALDAESIRLYQAGKYAQAAKVARQLLALREQTLGPGHAAVGTVLINLAEIDLAQGRPAQAEPLFKRGLAIWEKALGPGHADVAKTLNSLAVLYRDQGRLADAEPLFKRSLAIREKALGSGHPDVGQSVNNLAVLYQDQGRFADAEPLLKRSLAIREKALGSGHPDVGQSVNNLAALYRAQARFADAEPLFKRSLAILEKALGSGHPSVGQSVNNLAMLYRDQGRFTDAEPLFKRSLAIFEKALGPSHPNVALSLNNLAVVYQNQGRLAEAEPLFKRSLALREKVLPPSHPDIAQSLNNLAELYRTQDRLDEAETLFKRSLTIQEKALGPNHPDVAQSLNNLALLYHNQGRLAEVEPLLKRGLAIREKALGPSHADVGQSLANLATLYVTQERLTDAEPLFRRSLAVQEKALGPDHPNVGQLLNNLGGLYYEQDRLAEAEPLLKRSLAVREKAFGSSHPHVGESLSNLAWLYRRQNRLEEAELLLKRSLAVHEETLGPDHASVGQVLSNLAGLALGRSDWAGAADYWRRSTAVFKRRAARGLTRAAARPIKDEAQRWSWQFAALIAATRRLAAQRRSPGALAEETFETAQWAQSSDAAASLAQMAARSATGSPQLTAIARERQDLLSEWQAKDKLLIAAKSELPAKRKADAEKALADRLAAIDRRLAEIDRKLAKDFPDYAVLASPAPASIQDVQSLLDRDEALVLFLDTPEWLLQGTDRLPEESFVWIVTKSVAHLVRSELGTAALKREVGALRCGLDNAAWDREGRERCATALGTAMPVETPDPLPFDHGRAHRLYMGLFGEVRELIKGKHLLIVPSGALTQLPFQVLVTEPSAGVRRSGSDTVAPVAWLARSHAVTVLPAVSSLQALRRVGRPSAAPHPMIGFGNPLLDGYPGSAKDDAKAAQMAKEHAAWAKLARERQWCPETQPPRIAARDGTSRSVRRLDTRGGLASLAHLKAQVPLPETADELCAVARAVKAEPRDIRLGSQATEREVRRLNAGGDLVKYRMLHFATHGAVAGEIAGASEPGLILTPPETASAEDDGYLSASEIAGLKLDADWVVLSACNTAAGGAASAEALSGLARAFIYAGARALLVSHWAVDSEATQRLVTAALDEMARDAKAGRAEALRRAMLSLIDTGTPEVAHPAYWAPFVVVGEGAAR